MDKFVIKGGVPLEGEVQLSGAKNASLPIMAASLLTDGKCIIQGVPDVTDVKTMARILEFLGAKISFEKDRVEISPPKRPHFEAPYEFVKKMRASYYVLGPLIAKFKKARVSLPGGCAIGTRPVDLHLKGLQELGCNIDIVHGYIEASCQKLRGKHIYLAGPKGSSVGATINVMSAATLSSDTTVIEGAACEPEVVDCANFLKCMGAKIDDAGSPLIKIKGVKRLKGCSYRIIPDRIEAGTFAFAAAATNGDVKIKGGRVEHLQSVLDKLKEAGVKIKRIPGGIRVSSGRAKTPINISVAPYPGFPTDLQAQAMAMLTKVKGISIVTETIFENRFMQVPELIRLGADISIEGNSSIIKGKKRLEGAPVMASDLRASAALVIAGLIANGETSVSRIYHLDRGYESLEKKLGNLGAKIERVAE